MTDYTFLRPVDSEPLPPEKRGLLKAAARSLGSHEFRHLLARNGQGDVVDIVDGGRKACAYFISTLLTRQGLLGCPHATVRSTLDCMEQSGWRSDSEERVGNVVLWHPWSRDDNFHLGLVVGRGMYVANSTNRKAPQLADNDIHQEFGGVEYFYHEQALTDEDITSYLSSKW